MIAYLSGIVAEKALESVTLDVSGVGYGVYVTSEDLDSLTLNTDAKLYIHEHVREQAYDLYGFIKPSTRGLFRQLTEVNGVGPKMALNVLSIGSVDLVRQAIAEGNTKYLQTAQGVGKRVAERIVVDLKDKVGLVAAEGAASFLQEQSQVEDDALQALMELGFSQGDAAKALAQVDKDLETSQRVKEALKGKF
jgi:holliday junction DNA helicase RuvA